jgi:plasmid stabilization system protein ParE
MSRRIILAPQAIEDLGAVSRWYAKAGSGRAAERRLQAVRDGIANRTMLRMIGVLPAPPKPREQK